MRYQSPEARERSLARARAWKAANRERVRAYNRAKYDPEARRWRRIESQYGVTRDQWEATLASQGGRCAICHGEPGRKGFHVDHDHETGRFRGLLCHSCNVLLGHAGENGLVLMAAIRYLSGDLDR